MSKVEPQKEMGATVQLEPPPTIVPLRGASKGIAYSVIGCDDNPPGLTDNAIEKAETGDQMLHRAMVKDEQVLAQFDCYFPDGMIPVWKMVMYTFMTLGLYLFVLLARWFKRLCYKWRCCTPDEIEFSRSRMAITTKGRIFVWTEEVYQKKEEKKGGGCISKLCAPCLCIFKIIAKIFIQCFCKDACAPPTKYTIVSDLAIYGCSQIRQISQFYESKAAFLCCCVEYDCGVEVVIDDFNFDPSTFSCTTGQYPSGMYYATLASIMNSLVQYAGMMGFGDQQRILRITSDTYDRKHNGDIHAVLEDLVILQASIVEAMPNQQDCFIKNNDMKLNGNSRFDMTDKFVGVKIVEDNRKINIPTQWLSLQPGEEVIATNGEVYVMGIYDWVMTLITLGYYYCKEIRHLKYDRSAQIITNRRYIDVDIFQRAGEVPTHVTNFSIKCRSFFPGKVYSGYITSDCKTNLVSSILTDGGQLVVTFPSGRDALPFAKAMQMSQLRFDSKVEVSAISKGMTANIDKTDLEILPLIENDHLISSIEGEETWLPFGSNEKLLNCVNYFRAMCCCLPVTNACSSESLYCCFPICPYFLTCFLRPFRNNDDVLITGTSIIRYTRAGNSGICRNGVKCVTKEYFNVSWLPVVDLIGQTLHVDSSGREWWLSRCCRNNICGAIFCPIGTSSFKYGIDMRNAGFGTEGTGNNKNWYLDQKLTELRNMISELQVAIEEKHRKDAIMQRV